MQVIEKETIICKKDKNSYIINKVKIITKEKMTLKNLEERSNYFIERLTGQKPTKVNNKSWISLS
jgi:hypothetical protein